MLVFNQAELLQERHADDPADQFLDREILVDDLQDLNVVGFFRVNLRISRSNSRSSESVDGRERDARWPYASDRPPC
jgi:hypothetical protein